MDCQEDSECLGGSRVAWRAPSRKEVAEQLGAQQVARGRRVSRRAPVPFPGALLTAPDCRKYCWGQEGVKQPGGRMATRRAPNSE